MYRSLFLIACLSLLITSCNIFRPATQQPVAASGLETPTNSPASEETVTPLPPTNTPSPTDTPEPPTPTAGPLELGPENFPENISPLTGLAAADPELLKRRPLSVKVQIFPRNQRPVFGISNADLVFDYYQNNGMTRFHAIFYSQDAERVSPIRSARLFDQHLVRMYKSILAFGGADRRILRVFFNSNFADRLVLEGAQNCPPMCRVDPNGFNFLTTNTAELTQYALQKGIDNSPQNLNGMFFQELAPDGGQAANQLFVRFSISAYARWDYEPESGRYLRFQDTTETANADGEVYAPMMDGLTNQQIAADNVVVIYLAHMYAFQTKPGSANEIIDILMSGSAQAYALRDGQIYEVRWNRPENSSVLYLTYPDGRLFPFKPGNTWFEVIGQSSTLESKDGGIWRFQFKIP